VLSLFADNPFSQQPPFEVRAVLWQYWFTTISGKRKQGLWWRRQFLGLYAPTVERAPDGSIHVIDWPDVGPHE
jgi:lipase maturation factor 1